MVHKDRFAPSENGAAKFEFSKLSTAEQLIACFKSIEDAWKLAEDKIAETRVPVDVQVKIDDGFIQGELGAPIGNFVHYLSYCKVKGNRRICLVVEEDFGPGIETEIKPITECPVDTRLEMFRKFPDLYAEAKAVAQSYIPKIIEDVKKFHDILEFIDL